MPGRRHALIIHDGRETDNAMLATARDAQKNLLVLPVGVGTEAK